MCGSMADIQSATAEIRRGKKIERRWKKKKKPQGQKNIMSASAMHGGHNQCVCDKLTWNKTTTVVVPVSSEVV